MSDEDIGDIPFKNGANPENSVEENQDEEDEDDEEGVYVELGAFPMDRFI